MGLTSLANGPKLGPIPLPITARRLLSLLASILLVVLCSLAPASEAQSQTDKNGISLVHVIIVDVRSGNLAPDQTVVIEHDKILSVSPSKSAKLAPNLKTIDCTGLYLIPGLWDMHVHLEFGDWFPHSKEISLPLLIANGITGVRDMGSELETVQSWRTDIEAGTLIGPRIFTSGPMLDGPEPRFPSSIPIASPEDARRAVSDLKFRGADFIKLQSLIPREAVFAIADEARKQNIPFEGHVPDSVRASEMSEEGMKSFEHLIGVFEASSPLEDEFLQGNKNETRFLESYDPARAEKLAELLAANHTWQCPTLVWERGGNLLDVTDFSKDDRAKYAPSPWKNGTWQRFTDEIKHGYQTDNLATRKKFIEKELEVVRLLHKKGVPFLAGTDTPPGVYIFPGFSLHEELQRFVAAGFSPLEALQTATLNPAQFFGIESTSGTVEPGKLADLVLLRANPLSDISNTQKISAVVSHGRYFSSADLQKLFTQAQSAARQ